MTRYLNLAKAARLAGVTRQELQARVRSGELATFEGQVDVDVLARHFPDVIPEDAAVLERVRRLRERAVKKRDPGGVANELRLIEEVNRLELALEDTRLELDAYRRLCDDLVGRLDHIQSRCQHEPKTAIQALLQWMHVRLDRF